MIPAASAVPPADSMMLREAAVRLGEPRYAALADALDRLALNWTDVWAIDELLEASATGLADRGASASLQAYLLLLEERIAGFLQSGPPHHPGARALEARRRRPRVVVAPAGDAAAEAVLTEMSLGVLRPTVLAQTSASGARSPSESQ